MDSKDLKGLMGKYLKADTVTGVTILDTLEEGEGVYLDMEFFYNALYRLDDSEIITTLISDYELLEKIYTEYGITEI